MLKNIQKIAQSFPFLLEVATGNKALEADKEHHEFIGINKLGLMELFTPLYFTNEFFEEKVTYIGMGEGFKSACMLCYTHKIDVETLIYLN